MKVRDVMCKKVISVSPEATIKEVAKIVFSKKIQGVPVIDGKGKFLGIVTEGDILSKLYPSQKDFVEDFVNSSDFEDMEGGLKDVLKMRAREIMTKAAVCTYPDVKILRAASKMMVKRVGRLPVVDPESQKLLGVISKGDVIRAMIKGLRFGK